MVRVFVTSAQLSAIEYEVTKRRFLSPKKQLYPLRQPGIDARFCI